MDAVPAAIQNSVWKRTMSPELDELGPAAAPRRPAIKLSKVDVARVGYLSLLASKRTLSRQERNELELYLQIGHVITLMHSKARMALKQWLPRPKRKSA